MRLWAGASRRDEQEPRHDPGGGHAVLPRTGAPPRRQTLRLLGGHVERGLHLRRAAQPQDPLPGGQPAQTSRQNSRHTRLAKS